VFILDPPPSSCGRLDSASWLTQSWRPRRPAQQFVFDVDADPPVVSAVDAARAPTTTGDLRLKPVRPPAIDADDNDAPSPAGHRAQLYPHQSNVSGVADTGSGSNLLVDMGAYETIFADVSTIARLSLLCSATNAWMWPSRSCPRRA
jgi:hypothetical protein